MALFPKSRARIRKQASDWVARLEADATAEQLAAFEHWRNADPRHAEAYDRIASIWNQAGRLSRAPAAGQAPASASGTQGVRGFALAASLAAVLLVSAILFGARLLPVPGPGPQPVTLAAGAEEIRELVLADGSRVVLDSGSKVEAIFTRAGRRLTLKEGRARFRVAHETRPFSVRAGSTEVIATGTLFDVSLLGGRTAVLLLEGSVEVRPANNAARGSGPQRLRPGQKLILANLGAAERHKVTGEDLAWPSRMLEFDDVRLDSAAALVNRYSEVQLKLGDDRVRGLRVTGAFRTGDVAGFARSLAAAFGLELVKLPDGNLLLATATSGDRAPAR